MYLQFYVLCCESIGYCTPYTNDFSINVSRIYPLTCLFYLSGAEMVYSKPSAARMIVEKDLKLFNEELKHQGYSNSRYFLICFDEQHRTAYHVRIIPLSQMLTQKKSSYQL